jgi:hypothetical protein
MSTHQLGQLRKHVLEHITISPSYWPFQYALGMRIVPFVLEHPHGLYTR